MKKQFVSKKVACFNPILSAAVIAGDTVYFSGMLAMDPISGELSQGTSAHETKVIIENLKLMLEEMGLDLNAVVMAQCFLSSMEQNSGFGEAYANYFGHLECPPARRTTLSDLYAGCKVEISFIAHIDN